MENGIFQFIWRYSKKQQMIIMAMTAASLPFLYLVLDLPKYIINDAIDGKEFPKMLWGFEFTQIEYLFLLCAFLLALLIIDAVFSMKINTYKAVSSERLIRRLRYQLYENVLRFPPRHFQKVTPAEISSMVTAEVEPMGNFISDSFSMPMVQGGTMLTILFFMVVEDPILAMVAISMVPVQAWLIPKLQVKVNLLGLERVIKARKLAGWVGESVLGINDIHSNDASDYMQANASSKLGRIFNIRYELYQKKFFMKALNVFMSQLTPLFFYSIGGVLTIKGDLSLGALVAVLAAYNRFTTPWKELLKYYQTLHDVRIKYEQLVEQFQPSAMMDPAILKKRPETLPRLKDPLVLQNIRFVDEGIKVLEDVSISVEPRENIAIVSDPATRDKFAHLIARLAQPSGGSISVGKTNIATLPESVTGSAIGYAGPESYIFSGTVEDNILYGIKHTPINNGETLEEPGVVFQESVASGNSVHELDDNWIDYKSLGVSDENTLNEWVLKVIHAVELDDFLAIRSLSMGLDAEKNPGLAGDMMSARKRIAAKLRKNPESADLVHPFKFDQYNANSSVAANIIFGEPIDEEFEFRTLGGNLHVREVLDACDLTNRFISIGYQVGETAIELFGDMSSEQPLFENVSFVDEETLQKLKAITANDSHQDLAELTEEEKTLLVSLTLQLVVDRHRFGFIDDEMQQLILGARRAFRDKLPRGKNELIAFFDQEQFNSQLSNRCNLLLGRVNQTINNAEEKLNDITFDVLNKMDLTNKMILHATSFDVGVGGSKISQEDRQKVALARALIKRPDILVYNDALSSLDGETQTRIRQNIFNLLSDTTCVIFFSEMPDASEFKQVLTIRDGVIAERYVDNQREDLMPVVSETEHEETSAEEEEASPLTVKEEAAALANIPLFSAISPNHLKLLAFSSQRINFDEGQNLIDQGEIGKFAYVILEGEVDVIIGSGDKEIIVIHYGENELIGELSLLSNALTTATVRASMPVTALRIEKDVFLKLMRGDGMVATQVASWVSDRLIRSMKVVSKTA
jgi:putative ABC transport system ATP-binding protein